MKGRASQNDGTCSTQIREATGITMPEIGSRVLYRRCLRSVAWLRGFGGAKASVYIPTNIVSHITWKNQDLMMKAEGVQIPTDSEIEIALIKVCDNVVISQISQSRV